jgi:hypothetical protein
LLFKNRKYLISSSGDGRVIIAVLVYLSVDFC